MLRLIPFYIFIISTLFTSCQNFDVKSKQYTYDGISFDLPEKWIIFNDFYDAIDDSITNTELGINTNYDGSILGLVGLIEISTYTNLVFDIEEEMELAIKEMHDSFNIEEDKSVRRNIKFKGYDALEYSFVDNIDLESKSFGKYIIYTDSINTNWFFYYGNKRFMNSRELKHFIKSLQFGK